MKRHFKYLKYVLRHKWFVAIQCIRHGIFFRALTHDFSKFRPSEWFAYVNYFHGDKEPKELKNPTGYYKPTDTGDAAFDFAWLLHQKRNRHHWQWWILPEDGGGIKILPMNKTDRLEMLCDWWGASRAQGNGGWDGVLRWYEANKGKMQFHHETQAWIEWFLKGKNL